MIPGATPTSTARLASMARMTLCRMGRTGRKAAAVSPPTFHSTTAPLKMSDVAQRGFTLLEMVCVLAIIALLAAVLLPFIPHETSRSRLQAYALQTAALLKTDLNAAIRRGTGVTTLVDAEARAIRSGASRAAVLIPDDVRF